MPGIPGQQHAAARPSRPLQPQTLARQAQLHATQILQGNSQGWLKPAGRRPTVKEGYSD